MRRGRWFYSAWREFDCELFAFLRRCKTANYCLHFHVMAVFTIKTRATNKVYRFFIYLGYDHLAFVYALRCYFYSRLSAVHFPRLTQCGLMKNKSIWCNMTSVLHLCVSQWGGPWVIRLTSIVSIGSIYNNVTSMVALASIDTRNVTTGDMTTPQRLTWQHTINPDSRAIP